MAYRVDTATALDGQQDRVAVLRLLEGTVAVLADGAGGIGGGAKAAQAVIDGVTRAGWSSSSADWGRRLSQLDAEVGPGESTAVVVALSAAGLVGASIGDSEAWWFGTGLPVSLTRGQVRKPLLGSGSATAVGFTQETAGDGVLVVASDGLWKYTKLERVAAQLDAEPAAVARALVELVRYPGGSLPDDVAVAVCRIINR